MSTRALLALLVSSLCVACGDGDDDGVSDPCTGLELEACRSEPGCVADTCLECSCAPVFVGCRLAADDAHACPELGCAQPECCRTEDECTGGGQCTFEPVGCGACMPGPGDCTTDHDCTGVDVCDPITCSCEGARRCGPGCETTGCAVGLVCDTTTHRCAEQPCGSSNEPCPPNFSCTFPEGGCLRTSCTTDEHCPAGYCVLGLCQESLATCFIPPP
jgi:hypothetical protein